MKVRCVHFLTRLLLIPSVLPLLAPRLSGHYPQSLPLLTSLQWVNRTAKGNLVIISSPGTTSQQLSDALPYIKPVLEHGAGIPIEPFSGTKWRCVCINGVPTPQEGPAYMPGVIATQLKKHNSWSNNLRMPIQPYWIRPPSTIKMGQRSTIVLTFEDVDGTVQQGVLWQWKVFLFSWACTMRPWTEKKPTGDKQKKTAPVAPTTT